MGKGSKRRPRMVSDAEWTKNWRRVFGPQSQGHDSQATHPKEESALEPSNHGSRRSEKTLGAAALARP